MDVLHRVGPVRTGMAQPLRSCVAAFTSRAWRSRAQGAPASTADKINKANRHGQVVAPAAIATEGHSGGDAAVTTKGRAAEVVAEFYRSVHCFLHLNLRDGRSRLCLLK